MNDSTSPTRRTRKGSAKKEKKYEKVEIVFDFSKSTSLNDPDSPANLSDHANDGRANRLNKPIVFTFDKVHE